MIRLCQKFRTFKLSDAAVELKEVPCTFCNHPLSSHTITPGQDGSGVASNSSLFPTRKPAHGVYDGLALTNSSSLAFPPINSECLELILPANFEDGFMLLTVGKFLDSDILTLAVANQSTPNPTRHSNMQSPLESEKETLDAGDSPVGVSRKRVRGKQGSAASKRRSRRVASKKAKEEQAKVLKQLKGLKGISAGVSELGVDDGVEEMELEHTEVEYKQVLETTLGLIKKIDDRENYHTYCLPQVCNL